MNLSKPQRRKLLSQELIRQIESLPDDILLGVHDLTHEIMERRHGTNNRRDAARTIEKGGTK